MRNQSDMTYSVINEDQQAVTLTLFQVSNLISLHNNKAGCEPLSLDDAIDNADSTDNDIRQTAYEFGIERDFDFS